MSSGPPPVPGGRTPEEREAARREREARRTGETPPAASPPPQREPEAREELSPAASDTAAPAARARAWRRPRSAAPPAADTRGPASRDWLGEARVLTQPGPRGGRAGRRRRGPGRVIALGVLLVIVGALAWFANALFQPFKGDGGAPVRVTIPQGSGLAQIADRLEQAGVVEDAGFFQLRARLTGHTGDLRPGAYELRKDMSFTAALDALRHGVPPNVVQVAIPEGLSRREIRPLTKGLRGDYIRASRRSPRLDPTNYRAPRGASLEGFLFPATYELKKGRPVKALVGEQLDHFKSNFDRVDLSYAKRKNLTAYDVLIIASLIEREAMVARERPLIASVIYNRLHDGIPLGIDATVRYLTHNWKRPLRQSELANPSPYNTRVHAGLPPGPIGNPGLSSIRAAAHPAKTKFLFYVVKVDSCGRHKFAKTDAEFQAYVNEYNRARDERGGKSPTKC
ncbi:MAG TPA: endolytic transglycosylase MltG [Thermoleophilaceae bacterium]|nr:endolytic transglycosylase MltG [Thermoleophilaceae bacterium]